MNDSRLFSIANETTRLQRHVLIRNTLLLGTVFLAGLFAVSLLGCNNQSTGEQQQDSRSENTIVAISVEVDLVEPVDSIIQRRSYTGTIRSRQQSDLAFEMTGTVVRVLVDEGSTVVEGDVLAQLDVNSLVAKREAIQANLDQAIAVLSELKAGPRSQTIDVAKADLAEAASNLKIAELIWERRQLLLTQNAISKEELEQADYAVQAAKARLNSMVKRLDELKAGSRPEKIAAQKAVVRQFTASLAELNVSLDKSELVAPFNGRITQRFLDSGAIVRATQPVLQLVETKHLEAVIGLPVAAANSIAKGETHTIDIGALALKAIVLAKISRLDTRTRTQNIILELQNPDELEIVPGQLCKIHVDIEIKARGYWLPAGCLSEGVRGLWSMMVVVADEKGAARASRRDVEVVYTDGNRVLVRGTLDGPQHIIVSGVHKIVGGQLVEAIPSSSQANVETMDARR